MIITRTPYRISLFGGGSDFPEWYEHHGGSVLAGAIDKYCYLTLRWLPPFFEHNSRIVYSRIENATQINDIQHPVVREGLCLHGITQGIELHHDGDLPARSGIGSSAAFAVGPSHGVRALLAKSTDAWDLALEAIHLERDRLGENTGSQDQVICALGGFRHIEFHQDGSTSAESSSRLSASKSPLEKWLVLMYSRQQRSSSEINAGLVSSIASKRDLLERTSALAAIARAELEVDGEIDMEKIADLLEESWQIKLSLNPNAASDTILNIHNQGKKAGALAGKVAGAGGGGFMLFLVPPEIRTSFVNTMSKIALHVPFSFVDNGSEIILRDQSVTY